MTADPRETRLREIAQVKLRARELEAERNAILRELAAELGAGAITKLAGIAGPTRARVGRIVSTNGGGDDPRSR